MSPRIRYSPFALRCCSMVTFSFFFSSTVTKTKLNHFGISQFQSKSNSVIVFDTAVFINTFLLWFSKTMCAKVRSAAKTQLVKRSSPRIAQQSALSRRESNDGISQSKVRKTGKISFHQTSVHRRQTRNQSRELMSCITTKSVTSQSTTNMSVRGTPKPR